MESTGDFPQLPRLLGEDLELEATSEIPKSDRLLATKLGCSAQTVTAIRTELVAGAQIAQVDRLLGDDGKRYKQTTRLLPAPRRRRLSAGNRHIFSEN